MAELLVTNQLLVYVIHTSANNQWDDKAAPSVHIAFIL